MYRGGSNTRATVASARARGSAALTLALLTAGAVLALLAGCGRSGQEALSALQSARAQARARADATQERAQAADADMVNAVAQGGGASPISMRFRLEARPVVGTPLQILVTLVPADAASISHLHAAFLASEGLQLQASEPIDVTELRAGAVLQQHLTVLPQQSGVLSVSAVVTIDTDTTTVSRTYSIPLIAANAPS